MIKFSGSKAYENGKLVAFYKGAGFTKEELPIPDFPEYLLIFQEFADDPIELYAKNDRTAIDVAKYDYFGPFDIVEKIVTFRNVARIEDELVVK